MMRKIGPSDNGFRTLNSGKGFQNLEKHTLLKAAEDSLRFGRGNGFVNQFNTRSELNSARALKLDGMQADLAQRRLLEGNVTRSNTTEGRLNAPKMKKRVYVKQRDQKDLKDKTIQNYNVRKEKQGRRSDGAQSQLKPKISQAQQNPNARIPESRKKKSAPETEVESKRNGFGTETKGKKQASTEIYKVEKQEEEDEEGNKNATVQERKVKVDIRDSGEEFERNELPTKLKGKKKAPRSIHKYEKEEEQEISTVTISGIKEKQSDQDREEDSSRNEVQTRMRRKSSISKKIRKGEGAEKENSTTTIPAVREESDAQDRKEESNRNKLQARMRRKQPASKTIRKDKREAEEKEASVTARPRIEEENNAQDRKEESNRKEPQVRMRRKQPVSKSIRKGEKQEEEEEDPNARMPEIKNEKIAQHSEEESGIKEFQTRLKGKKPVFKSTPKAEEEEEENRNATMPENKEKQNTEDSGEESKSNDLQNKVKKETLAPESVRKDEKNVNDDGLELAEEFPSPDQSDFESLNNTKDHDESRDDKSQATQKLEADQVELNEAVSDKDTKRVNGKGRERGILKQEETNAEESTESDIKVDEVESTTNSKFPETEEDDAGESANNDVIDENESQTVPISKQSKSNFQKPAEDNADESAKNNIEEDAESGTVPTGNQSSSVDVEESAVNSTESVEESEGEYSDFINEMADLPSKFQDTAEKVADRLMPEIQKFSNKSKIYFSRANEGIADGFRPLIGHQYAPFVASVISYIFVLLPLILVIVSFDQIRTYFPLQKVILFANIYLAAYFTTLVLASFLIGMEPMLYFFRNSLSGYIYLQLLEALGYMLYLVLQCLNLIISFSNGSTSAKLVAFLQSGVSIFIGLHYYVTVFHRAMAQKAPRTSWKIHVAYTIVFFVLCLFSKIKHGKKEYVQEQYGSGTNKKN